MNFNRPIEILIILIAISAPIIKKVLESLARQRAQSRADAGRQKQIEENLRTGRGSEARVPVARRPTAQATTPATVETDALARRRQAQVEELRRRTKQRAASTADSVSRVPRTPGPAVPMPRPTRGSSGVGRPSPRGQSPARAGPEPGARSAPTNERRRTAGAPSGRRPADRPASLPARSGPPAPAAPTIRRLVADTEPVASAESSRPMVDAAVDLLSLRSADWRRAVVMRELLDLPIALRPVEEA